MRWTAFILSLLVATPCWAAASTSFDNANDNVVFGNVNVLEDQAAMTIVFWAKVNNVTDDNCVAADVEFVGSYSGWVIQADDVLGSVTDAWAFILWDGNHSTTSIRVLGETSSVLNNTWQRVAATFTANNASGLRIYIDGTESATSPVSTSGYTSAGGGTANAMRIGEINDGSNDFHGQVAYFQGWSRVLTLEETEQALTCPGSIPADFYDPGWGGDSQHKDLAGGLTGAVTGATSSTDGPPIMQGCGSLQ